jgi:hypothetical protein
VEDLEYHVEATLRRSVPGEKMDQEVAQNQPSKGEDEEEGRVLQGIPVESLPAVVDEVVDDGGRDPRDDAGCDGEEPP